MSTSLSPLCTVMYVLVVQNWSLQRKAIHACHFHAWLYSFQVQIKSIAWLCCKSVLSLNFGQCLMKQYLIEISVLHVYSMGILFFLPIALQVTEVSFSFLHQLDGIETQSKMLPSLAALLLFCESCSVKTRRKGNPFPALPHPRQQHFAPS